MLRDCAVGQAIEEGEHVFVFFNFKGGFAKVVAKGQVEPAGEPAVHGFAHFEVVAVGRVNLDLRDAVVGVVEVVDAFDGGVFDIGGVLRPVLCGTDEDEGFGREGGADIDVVGVDTQQGRVFTDTAALHVGGDHADGCGDVQAVINGIEVIGLGASARFARATQAVGIDFGEFAEEVEYADAVPELKTEDADVPEHAVVLSVGPGCAVYNTVGFFPGTRRRDGGHCRCNRPCPT